MPQLLKAIFSKKCWILFFKRIDFAFGALCASTPNNFGDCDPIEMSPTGGLRMPVEIEIDMTKKTWAYINNNNSI